MIVHPVVGWRVHVSGSTFPSASVWHPSVHPLVHPSAHGCEALSQVGPVGALPSPHWYPSPSLRPVGALLSAISVSNVSLKSTPFKTDAKRRRTGRIILPCPSRVGYTLNVPGMRYRR